MNFDNVYGVESFHLTAGQKDYADRLVMMESGVQGYYKKSGIPPGPPTNKGQNADPYATDVALPNVPLGDYSVPSGWPTDPKFNGPGDVPGPPAMWEDEEDISDPPAGYGFTPDSTPELEVFFFHTDHLGSTSYLTDSAGSVCQFVCYTPYGEAFVDEHTTTYENPFKFSGKELDDVTGLYDHGARSRNPITTIWLGVDPVFHPASSPYAYCLGNPVRLIDPNGMEEEENNVSFWDKVEKAIKKIDKGGTSDPSNSGSDESVKSLKDKVVKFYTEVVESLEKSAVGSDKSGTPPAEGGKGTQGYGNGKDPNNAATEKGKSQGNAIDHSDDGQGALEKYYHPEGYTGVCPDVQNIAPKQKEVPEGMDRIPVYIEGVAFRRSDGGMETPILGKKDTVVRKEFADSLEKRNHERLYRRQK